MVESRWLRRLEQSGRGWAWDRLVDVEGMDGSLMSAKKAVFVAVSSTVSGRRGSSDIVGNLVDKGLVISSEGFDGGPRLSVD